MGKPKKVTSTCQVEVQCVSIPHIEIPSDTPRNVAKALELLDRMASTGEQIYIHGIECSGKTEMIKCFMELNQGQQQQSLDTKNMRRKTFKINSETPNKSTRNLRRTTIASSLTPRKGIVKIQSKNKSPVRNIYMDCALAGSPAELLRDILNELFAQSIGSPTAVSSMPTGPHRFLTFLHDLVASNATFFRDTRFFIILDHVDHLERPEFNECLSFLYMLSEYCNCTDTLNVTNFTTIIIGQSSWQHFDSKAQMNKFNPFPIKVDPFDKQDIKSMIQNELPARMTEHYSSFVNNMVNLYHAKSKSYDELRYLCQQSFVKFVCMAENCATLINNQTTDEDSTELDSSNSFIDVVDDMSFQRLWKTFSETLKRDKQEYCDLLNARRVPIEQPSIDLVDHKLLVSQDIRIMLIASYIAAHTTPIDDKINFAKENAAKMGRRRARQVESSCLERSGRPFTVERVLQIGQRLKDHTYYERIDEPHDGDFSDSLMRALISLVSCRLLRTVLRDGCSSDNKYAVSDTLDFEFARSLARQSEIRLEDYLGMSS